MVVIWKKLFSIAHGLPLNSIQNLGILKYGPLVGIQKNSKQNLSKYNRIYWKIHWERPCVVNRPVDGMYLLYKNDKRNSYYYIMKNVHGNSDDDLFV